MNSLVTTKLYPFIFNKLDVINKIVSAGVRRSAMRSAFYQTARCWPVLGTSSRQPTHTTPRIIKQTHRNHIMNKLIRTISENAGYKMINASISELSDLKLKRRNPCNAMRPFNYENVNHMVKMNLIDFFKLAYNLKPSL